MIGYAVKTTPELTAADFRQLCELFTEVFEKPCPEDVLRRKYSSPVLGYSIHSLMMDGSRIVGAFSAMPLRYRFFGRDVLFAPTADLMIAQPYRGPVKQLQTLGLGLFDGLRNAGVAFVFACLREEMKIVHQAASRWRTVGKVFYYVAPRNALARTLLRPGKSSGGAGKWSIEKIADEPFSRWRYGFFPSPYRTVELAGGAAVYTTQPFYPIAGLSPGLRVGLLLDVSPLDAVTFNCAIEEICRREPRLHCIAYQGCLPFHPRGMFRVPPRFEKKAWFVAGRILREDQVDERIFDIAHWNINLSNGDLV